MLTSTSRGADEVEKNPLGPRIHTQLSAQAARIGPNAASAQHSACLPLAGVAGPPVGETTLR
ncbi:hypothetical protein DXU92_08370 [Brachybacterium saurashtrense]|uniref:Uncharacterized protein n=1 Tax=Brachybacterium saurashtrense TaxID=556288 RepID=A0AA93AU56_9MICO|nr:hypothetical protein DXU92_08370 [Brachybacterium saurashtrense]